MGAFNIFFLIGMSLSLVSCYQKETTYDYLLQHPADVQTLLSQCDGNSSKECENARRAEQDFQTLMHDRDQDPEKFGQRILAAEYDLVQKRHALELAKAEFKTHPEKTELKQNIDSLSDAYQSQLQSVNTMLAIISVSGSPQ